MEAPEITADFIPGSSFSEDDPVQYALSIHLVLRYLFSQFGKQKDLKSLLAVRAVCTLWWIEALDILHDFSELLPNIFSDIPNFNEFDERIKPSDAIPIGGLPINLTVSEWTPQVVRFLKDRADDIASLHLHISSFCRFSFSLEQESFRLENLRFASLSFSDVAAESYHGKTVQDGLILFLDLIKRAKNLKICEVFLGGFSVGTNYQDELSHLPRNLTTLQASLDCMEKIALLPPCHRLHRLCLSVLPDNRILSSQYINDAASRLTSLALSKRDLPGNGEMDTLSLFQLPLLPELTELALGDIGIHGDLPIPELMPQLQTVNIFQDCNYPQNILESLLTTDFCYPKVNDFSVRENGTLYHILQNADHVTRITALTKSFPNLVKLRIFSGDFNIVATAPIIFSCLQRLKHLTLESYSYALGVMDYDVIQLITGVSREEIPEDESTWPDCLVASPNAITKLTSLEEFTLTVNNERIVTQRESKFMFKAAFLRMIHLKLISFEYPVLFDRLENEVQEEWKAGGRVVRIWVSQEDNENGARQDDNDNELRGQNEEREEENERRDEDE